MVQERENFLANRSELLLGLMEFADCTDEYGYHAIDKKVEIHDLHATMLHLLGIDHEQLTFRFSGRDMRLTDVHGHVVRGILA